MIMSRPDNPVHFIDAFVDGLDLTAAGFLRGEAKATGIADFRRDNRGALTAISRAIRWRNSSARRRSRHL
jgi:hypothetical protein